MTIAVLLGMIGPWQVVIILVVILLFFGGKKIPEMMKGLGKGVKSFKEGMNEEDTETSSDKKEESEKD